MLDSGRNVALIDVREPVEWDINHIDGAELIPKSAIEAGRRSGEAAARPDAGAVLQDRGPLGRGAGRGEEGRLLRRAAPAGRHRGVGATTRTRHGDVLTAR